MSSFGARYNAVSIAHSSDHLHETFHVSVTDTIDLYLALGFSSIRDEALCRNTMYSVVQMLQQELFAGGAKKIFESFEKGLKEVNKYLAKRNLHEIGLFHAAVGLQVDDVLHVTKTGAGEAYLIRKHSVTNITADFDDTFEDDLDLSSPTVADMMEKGNHEFFSNIASGETEENDILLFASYRLSRFVDANLLQSFFGKGQMEVGFLNLEHKLKEDKSSDVALLGSKVLSLATEPVKKPSFSLSKQKETLSNISKRIPRVKPKMPSIKLDPAKQKISDAKGSLSSFYDSSMQYFNDPGQRRKLYTFITVLLLIVLVFSVGSGLSSNQSAELKKEFEISFNKARNELSLAKNENIKGDKASARVHLDSAKDIAVDLKDKNIGAADVSALLEEIQKEEDTTNNVQRVTEDDLFLDLASKLEGDTPTGLVHYQERLYAYSSSSIYGPFISSSADSGKKFTLDTNDLILDVIPFEDIDGLLLKLTPDKVAQFVNGSFSFTDTTGVSWKSGSSIASFGSNMYIMGSDQIWKYTRNRSTYRGPTPWLKAVDNSLADAVSMSIDGSIYVLMKDGSITKYFRGAKDTEFSVKEAPSELLGSMDDQSEIFGSAEWSDMYVFNHEKALVGKFEKSVSNLTFDKQYRFDGLDIVTVTISEDASTLYAIASDLKVYRVSL